jgi:hypothetical protein
VERIHTCDGLRERLDKARASGQRVGMVGTSGALHLPATSSGVPHLDGEPPIVATFGWPAGVEPGAANSLLNTARAMNIIPRLVAAPPGCVSVLDFPVVVAGDGLAPA